MSQAAFRMDRIGPRGLVLTDMAGSSLRHRLRDRVRVLDAGLNGRLGARLFDEQPNCQLAVLWVLRDYLWDLKGKA